MSYRLKRSEPLSPGVRRIARSAARSIRKHLKSGCEQSKSVHEARRHIKKLRALTRLVRKQIGKRSYARCNRLLKELAKSLAPLRDATVHLNTLQRLKPANSNGLYEVSDWQKAFIEAHRGRLQESDRIQKWRKKKIQKLSEKIGKWPLKGLNRGVLEEGINCSGKRLRQRFQTAQQEPALENLHAWRKAAKDLLNQLAMMKELEPVDQKETADLKKLGILLGDDRDLAMLVVEAGNLRRPLGKPLKLTIHKRRMTLQKAAFKLGRKLGMA
jgi:CHAD domain-containing protein